MSFDGANDYVNVPASASINPSYITVEAWIKTTQSIWGGITTFSTAYTFALAVSKSGSGNLDLITDGVSAGLQERGVAVGINDGAWHHVAASYDGNYQRIYKDGVQVGVWAYTAGALDYSGAARNFILGYRADLPDSSRFNGFIDEVRIYETALTLGRIRQHYTEGLERHNGLVVQ